MPRNRDQTIDIAKGLAIAMIVLGHVLRGMASSRLVNADATWYVAVDSALYQVHLAAFVFLAGLFVKSGVERRGARSYLATSGLTLGYVYIVWTMLQGAVKVLTARLVNTPLTPIGVVQALWEPDGQLWYLPFFLLLTVAVVLVRPWASTPRSIVVIAAALVLAVFAWGDPWGGLFFQRGWALTPFFVAGVLMGHRRFLALVDRTRGWGLALPGVAVFAVVQGGHPIPPTSAPAGVTAPGLLLGAVGAVSGIAALVGFSRLLTRVSVLAAALGSWGRYSMEIFLAHIIVASGLRIVLGRLGIADAALIIATSTAAGVLCPWLLALAATRNRGIALLFRAPERLTALMAGSRATAIDQ